MDSDHPILLFDGVCNLCSGAVQFVLKRNKKKDIRFASLQSEFGKKALVDNSIDPTLLTSLVLLENGKAFIKSDAALRVTLHLCGGWPLLSALLIVPKFIRDPIYGFIAEHRYRWFGKQESCWIPSPEWKDRFLDAAPQ